MGPLDPADSDICPYFFALSDLLDTADEQGRDSSLLPLYDRLNAADPGPLLFVIQDGILYSRSLRSHGSPLLLVVSHCLR